MSLVTGEDSESDEEINTEQLGAQMLSRGTNLAGGSTRGGIGIIAGEDDEDGDDDEGTKIDIIHND